MRITDYKGEDALDLLADILEPAAEVFGDKEFQRVYPNGSRLKAAQYALKNHKAEILQIMARVEGVDVSEYNPGVWALPGLLLDLLNDPELVSLFTSQGQSAEKTSSGPATENTGATEKE